MEVELELKRGEASEVFELARKLSHLGSHRHQRNVHDDAGRENYYGIELRGLMAARSYLEGFWGDVLSAFQAAALAEARQRRRKN